MKKPEIERIEREALSAALNAGPAALTVHGLRSFHFSEQRGQLFHLLTVAAKDVPGGIPPLTRVIELAGNELDSGIPGDNLGQWLSELMMIGYMPGHEAYYAKELKEAWLLRETCRVALDLAAAAEEGNAVTVEALRGKLESLQAKATEKAASVGVWTVEGILAHEPDPRDEIWSNGILYAGERAAIIGAPGTGKSRLVLQSAVHTILGMVFLGWKTRAPGEKWLFLQTENNARRLKHDLQKMTAGLTREQMALLNECLIIMSIEADPHGTMFLEAGSRDQARFKDLIARINPAVVVIDPLRDTTTGDLNKDADMTAATAGIKELVMAGNPRRVPLVVHHGRTGASEASKVFGDDAGSFGRNSKVLYGWLRSQINVAPAGVEHEGVVIVGCGKNSNGVLWKPFAAQLDEKTMLYHRLEEKDFDLDQWTEEMGKGGSGRKGKERTITPEQVASVLLKHGGSLKGGMNSPDGLNAKLQRAFSLSRPVAQSAIDNALGETIQRIGEIRMGRGIGSTGGNPACVYILKNPNESEL